MIRPRYNNIQLPAALRQSWRGWHLSEKMDGVWEVRDLAGCTVTGEAMRNGEFLPFDIVTAFGVDVRRLPWTDRAKALAELLTIAPPSWRPCATGHGAEFIETVLAHGGEGAVAKPCDAPYGIGWTKVKRLVTFDCIITELDGARGSARLAKHGADCGWCPARRAFDSLRVGDIIEVAAHSVTAKGKLREPRFIRRRPDLVDSCQRRG